MTYIDAAELDYTALNSEIRRSSGNLTLTNVLGQRFIAAGRGNEGDISIDGVPGNALGAYLDGCRVTVRGNAQDAVGDTMNEGEIVIHGNAGDGTGYAMRGGRIYIKGKSGYRTGIHMKEYGEKRPLIIVGKTAGCFLGEYMAGGTVVVLNLENEAQPLADFTGSGMHGGRIFVRCSEAPENLPKQVSIRKADESDLAKTSDFIKDFCCVFDLDCGKILSDDFFVLTPDAKNPYKRLYAFM